MMWSRIGTFGKQVDHLISDSVSEAFVDLVIEQVSYAIGNVISKTSCEPVGNMV